MIRSLLILLAVIPFAVQAQKRKVQLNFTYTEPYCGGARPSEEMRSQAAKKIPYAGRMVIFVSQKGKIDSARTDSTGTLNLKLKKGSYRLIEPWRYYLNTPDDGDVNNYDLNCLKAEWQKEILNVTVTRRSVSVQPRNGIIKYCSWQLPCLREREVPPGR